jgi:hypothetical protein
MDFKNICASFGSQVLCNILNELITLIKLVTLLIMCLNETYGKVWVGIHLPNTVPVQDKLNLRDALLLIRFKFALVHVIRKVQVNQGGRKLNVTLQLLVGAHYVTFQDKNT